MLFVPKLVKCRLKIRLFSRDDVISANNSFKKMQLFSVCLKRMENKKLKQSGRQWNRKAYNKLSDSKNAGMQGSYLKTLPILLYFIRCICFGWLCY